MNIVYRKAKVDDYDGIYYVSCYSWDETYRGLLPDEYLDDRINNYEERKLRTKKFLEKLEEAGDLDKYLVCEVDSKIVGICQWSKPLNENYKNHGLLGALYVLKKYQKLGIGRDMFRMAVEGLMAIGYDTMYLECMTGNDSVNFYKKYGGIIVENIDYPISDFTVKADILVYDDLSKTKELLSK